MPPKKGKKRSKKGKKSKNNPKKIVVAADDSEIENLKREIDEEKSLLEWNILRRTGVMNALTKRCEDSQLELRQATDDNRDIINYLKRYFNRLYGEYEEITNAIEEVKQRREIDMEGLEKRLKQHNQNQLDQLDRMKNERRKLQLKLATMEEYRFQKDQLSGRLKKAEDIIANAEKNYKTKLNAMEKKSILHFSKINDELVPRTNQLAKEFAQMSESFIADSIKAAILQCFEANEKLLQTSHKASILTEDNQNLLRDTRSSERIVAVLEDGNKSIQRKVDRQFNIIKNYTHDLEQLEKRKYEILDWQEKYVLLEAVGRRLKDHLKIIMNNLKKTIRVKNEINLDLEEIKDYQKLIIAYNKKLIAMIEKALSIISTSFMRRKEDEEEDDYIARRSQLMSQLLLILDKASSMKMFDIIEATNFETNFISQAELDEWDVPYLPINYQEGDLGFSQRPVQSKDYGKHITMINDVNIQCAELPACTIVATETIGHADAAVQTGRGILHERFFFHKAYKLKAFKQKIKAELEFELNKERR